MPTNNVEIPQSLVDEIRRGRASLLLGAGASAEAGFPGSADLAEMLISATDPNIAKNLRGKALDAVALSLYRQPAYGQVWVRRKIIEIFTGLHTAAKRPPSRAHARMALTQWRTIFTTNYDRLIEATYDNLPDVAQNCLPIFTPDLQVKRHEPETIRVIKLNGSFDEAARTGTHRLVLTFNEQQQARADNSLFYELLRTEAINGPIIFIGFRFSHPGANFGTSPEFLELQSILQQMGPSANWHYCVTPFPEDPNEAKLFQEILHANQILAIDATFGEFMDGLKEALDSPATLGSRPPSIVPIGKQELRVPADEASRDLRQFELLTTALRNTIAPSVRDSLDGKWNWGSFREGHFIERDCAKNFDRLVDESSESSGQLVLVEAPPGWGKTIFLRQASMRAMASGRMTAWLNPHGSLEISGGDRTVVLGTWDSKRIGRLLEEARDISVRQGLNVKQTAPLLIADNCTERALEVGILYKELSRLQIPFVLVFALRDDEVAEVVKNSPVMQSATRTTLKSEDVSKEMERLVEHCLRHQVVPPDDQIPKELLVARILYEEAELQLIFALQVIFDKNHRPFSEIVGDYWDRLPSDLARRVVLRVSSIHQYGSACIPRLYSVVSSFPLAEQRAALEEYKECLRRRILSERMDEDEPCVQTLHSLVAERLVKVSGRKPREVDQELVNLVARMTNSSRDLEVVRGLLRRVTDYKLNLSGEEQTKELFEAAVKATRDDWVVCQQYAKFLNKRGEFELAYHWAKRATDQNPYHGPLAHTKGNVLRRWGMALLHDGQKLEAYAKFDEARAQFAASRIRKEPDEYGYVTHLDMLISLLENSNDDDERANLQAEGASLFRAGTRMVGQEKLNFLLESKYQKHFDVHGKATQELCIRLESSLRSGRASSSAIAFLADTYLARGNPDNAILVLNEQRKHSPTSPLMWIKEAEILAKCGRLNEANKALDAARRRREHAETPEVTWLVSYWDLIISFASGNYGSARQAAGPLLAEDGAIHRRLPRGYIWLDRARNVAVERRSFATDAKIYRGVVRRLQAGSRFGHAEVVSPAGETFSLEFNPRGAGRRDYRIGDHIEFVVAILPKGLRADHVTARPFTDTGDDIFVPLVGP